MVNKPKQIEFFDILIQQHKKLIWKRSGEKPLSMGCQATQRNSSVNICSNTNRISLSIRSYNFNG